MTGAFRRWLREMRGICDMGQSKKIDSRSSYEAIFSGLPLNYPKAVLLMQDQIFAIIKWLSYSYWNDELMIVD